MTMEFGDVDFERGGAHFGLRVAAVAIQDAHVLLEGDWRDDIVTLPGGRVMLGETAHEAVAREMREELGVAVQVERLLWVVENLFEVGGQANFHEVGFYFLVTLPPEAGLTPAAGAFGNRDATTPTLLHWQPVAGLDRLPLYPVFLRAALRALPDITEHVVNRDRRAGEAPP